MIPARQGKILYNLPQEEKENKVDSFIQTLFGFGEHFQYVNELLRSDFMKELEASRTRNRYSCDLGLNPKAMSSVYAYIRKYKPNTIIETGVHFGFSTSVILYALHKNQQGHLTSISYSKREGHAKYVPKNLKYRWTFIEDKTQNVLPKMDNSIDVFLHDSEHSYDCMTFEYQWALDHLKKDGIIFSHDIGSNNAFFDFIENHNVDWYLIKCNAPSIYGMGCMRILQDTLTEAKGDFY